MRHLFAQLGSLSSRLSGDSHRGVRRGSYSLAGVQELVKFLRRADKDDAVKAGALIVLLLLLEVLRH